MAMVAIILSSLFTSGSCGSTAWSRESANALLDLEDPEPGVHVPAPLYINMFCHVVGNRHERWRPSLFKLTVNTPGVDGEPPGLAALHQHAEDLLPRLRVTPQQGLMGEGLLDLARHPVVGVDHAFGHGLVDLQVLPGDQGRDVPLLVQLGAHLRTVYAYRCVGASGTVG